MQVRENVTCEVCCCQGLPHDIKRNTREKRQQSQLELGGPKNQGCIRIPISYSDGNAMGHHLLARIFPQHRQTGFWRKISLFQRSKDVGCTCNSPQKGRGNNSKRRRWRIQVGSHRSHHQQCTKDHHISTSSTQATSTRAVHSNTGGGRHELGKVSEARNAKGTRRECEAGRKQRPSSRTS